MRTMRTTTRTAAGTEVAALLAELGNRALAGMLN